MAWREAIVPLWILGLLVGLAWIGLRDLLPGVAGAVVVWSLAALGLTAAVRAGLRIRRRWARVARRAAALGRIERASGLSRGALRGLEDELADPEASEATRALWAAHRRRAAAAIGEMTAGAPRPDLGRRDRWAARPALALLLFVGWFAAGGEHGERLLHAFSSGFLPAPTDRLDVWVEPPLHTGLPARSLVVDGRAAEAGEIAIDAPVGSRLVARVSPGVPERPAGAVDVTARPAASLVLDAAPTEVAVVKGGTVERRWALAGDGEATLRHAGREALRLRLRPTPDRAPTVALVEPPSRRGRGGLRLVYEIGDDYGVVSATARTALPPSAGRPLYEAPSFPLVLPVGGRHLGRAETVRDLTDHPLAGAEVTLEATATDGAGQEGRSAPATVRLPERPFRDPLARALIELRRRLALDAHAIGTVAIALDALTMAPERFAPRTGVYLGLRHLALAAGTARDDADLRALVDDLWQAASVIEAGDTLDEEKALRAAREALAEALRSGASEEEIARLTRELRQAMERYLQALSEAARRDPGARDRMEGRARRVDRQSLSRTLDRIEALGRTGSREAAERLLAELGDTLDGLRGARSGEAGGGEAQRALGEMIRRQRDLMDRTRRADRDGADAGERERLLGEQRALRDDLGRLRRSTGPSGGAESGDDEEGPLGDAGRAMDDAGGAIDRGDGEEAVDAQGRALDGLKRGAREMARGRGEGEGREGAEGRDGEGDEDPLGRPRRSRDADGGRLGLPQTIDVERARRILDDIRRRLGDPARPSEERDYLDRLLKID